MALSIDAAGDAPDAGPATAGVGDATDAALTGVPGLLAGTTAAGVDDGASARQAPSSAPSTMTKPAAMGNDGPGNALKRGAPRSNATSTATNAIALATPTRNENRSNVELPYVIATGHAGSRNDHGHSSPSSRPYAGLTASLDGSRDRV